MIKSRIDVSLCANDRYVTGLYCAIGSAIKSLSPGIAATFHVIDAGLSPGNKERIEALVASTAHHALRWVHPSSERFEKVHSGNYHISACYRLALPELLSGDRVIYLDADMLVLSCLGELWERAESCVMSAHAVKDWETPNLTADCKELADGIGEALSSAYFNSGLLVLDLAEAREQGLTGQLLGILEKFGHLARFADQTALNYCLAGRIHPLDPGWNTPAWAFDKQADNSLPKIVHFTNQAPWLVRRFSPSQALFERIALDLGIDLPVPERSLNRSVAGALVSWLLAPVRMMLHGLRGGLANFRGKAEETSGHLHIFRHWLEYFTGGPARSLRYGHRVCEIRDPAFRIFPDKSA